MTSDIDHDQLVRIEIGDIVTTDRHDGYRYARAYHTDQELRNEPFVPAGVDEFALLRDISRGDTIEATAHVTCTLRDAVQPINATQAATDLAEQDGLPFEDVYATVLRDACGADPSEIAAMTDIDEGWINLTCETTNKAIQDIMDAEAEAEAEADDGDDSDGEVVDMSSREEFQTTLGFAAGSDVQP